MKKEDLIETVNSFKTFDEIYEHLVIDDFSVISRKCGTNEYPQINWMIDAFLKTEDYEKCEFLKNLKLPKPSNDELNKELKWLKLNT